MEKVSFAQQVYTLCKQIPPGKVTTYKEIARVLNTKGYQAIGQALKCNPYAPIVPCHRIINSDGSLGGFNGTLSKKVTREKAQLLRKEGIIIINNNIDLKKYFHHF